MYRAQVAVLDGEDGDVAWSVRRFAKGDFYICQSFRERVCVLA